MLYSNGLVQNYIIQIRSYLNNIIVGEHQLASCPRDARGEEDSKGRPQTEYSKSPILGFCSVWMAPKHSYVPVGLYS